MYRIYLPSSEPLSDYYVTARRDDVHSSALLCDMNRERALAEDPGCTTGRLDGRLWEEAPNASCDFQLDLTTVNLAK